MLHQKLRKVNIAAKNFRRESEDAAEGGCGGNSAASEHRSPAAPSEYLEGETEQKISSSFLEEKIGRAQNQKRGGYFFARLPPER